MNDSNHTRVPLKLHLWMSVLGGVLGALNPVLFAFPGAVVQMAQKFQLAQAAFSMAAGSVLLLVLFVPCAVATYFAYPWLYRKIQGAVRRGDAFGVFTHVKLGVLYGIRASFVAAFVLVVEALLFNLLSGHAASMSEALLLLSAGALFLGFAAALVFLPQIVIVGSFFAWLNYRIIRS